MHALVAVSGTPQKQIRFPVRACCLLGNDGENKNEVRSLRQHHWKSVDTMKSSRLRQGSMIIAHRLSVNLYQIIKKS